MPTVAALPSGDVRSRDGHFHELYAVHSCIPVQTGQPLGHVGAHEAFRLGLELEDNGFGHVAGTIEKLGELLGLDVKRAV